MKPAGGGDTETPTVSEQQISIDAVSDEEIRERLSRIFETTERFKNLELRVQDGVVFLRGETDREEYRDWARDVALRTQDVVAVANDLEVISQAQSLWDFAPAVEELWSLWRASIRQFPLMIAGVVLLLLTAAVARAAYVLVAPMLRRRISNPMLRTVAANAVIVLVGIVGVYIALRVVGLTRLAFTMLGGTGLAGLIIGFAFRDIAENFLASLLISVQRPFRVGDTIEVAGYTGLVQKVTTRGTVLMAFDGNYIQLPNALVYKSIIRNLTTNPRMRLDFTVGIGYDADVVEAQSVLLKVAQGHQAVFDDPEPRVFVEKLGTSTIELHAYFWINVAQFSQFKVKSSVMRQSVAELIKAGISLPDDNREVIFPQGVPVRMLPEPAAREKATTRRRDAARASAPIPAVTEAEGELVSETGELQAQADSSVAPEGEDILSGDDGRRKKA